MRALPAALAALLCVSAVPSVHAQKSSDRAEMRDRALANCKANRGVNCDTPAGLQEWVDAERPRPPDQRAPLMQQKLEAERQAQQREAEAARKRASEERKATCARPGAPNC